MKHELLGYVDQATEGFGFAIAREYLQARILQHIGLSGQMTSLAFMGGTALRFLYGVPRYSEDLDFALETNQDSYAFGDVLGVIARGFEREGYEVDIKFNQSRTAVDKAFVKFPGLLYEIGLSPHASEVLSVKVEVDTNPPAGAICDVSEVRRFVLIRMYHHDRASLMAGKLAGVLMRQYTKGRDLYDLMWYLSDRSWPQPNATLLRNAADRGGFADPASLDAAGWRDAVLARLSSVDWAKARGEAVQFLERPLEADLLEYATFERLLCCSTLVARSDARSGIDYGASMT
ncbi:MAG: nucleotidyl transferase AbiEii/AbiGii toxin family protein [Coriobacteriia bacterium]|nr:nucleotidyl transferase AbiEii/AbiGii toxin family protein [Coriobacteriia bacterium]